MNIGIFGWVVIILLIALIGLTIFMLISISKTGDERRQLIMNRATSNSFIGAVAILVIETIRMLATGESYESNPFLMLAFVSLVFLISLIINKKRYGG